MRFDPDYVLYGSLRYAVEAIFNAVQFVAYWAKKRENICPWQLDLILGYARKIPKNQTDEDDDDDDDDDDDGDDEPDEKDEKAGGQIKDIIENIQQRLLDSSDDLAFFEASGPKRLWTLYKKALEGLMDKNN